MKKRVLAIFACIAISGCAATQSQVIITDASRADGTVTVGYSANDIFGGLQNTQPSFVGGKEKAATACEKWGYKTASALDDDAFNYSCQNYDPLAGCMAATFAKVYQCVGDKPETVNK